MADNLGELKLEIKKEHMHRLAKAIKAAGFILVYDGDRSTGKTYLTIAEGHDEIDELWEGQRTDLLVKIMADIEKLPSDLTEDGRRTVRRGSVFRVIGKYIAESEE